LLRHATPQEIESHLRKICDEKALTKDGIRLKSAVSSLEFIFDSKNPIYYNEIEDMLYTGIWGLYYNGKFAEIIEEKKRLPKTKEELLKIFEDYLQGKKDYIEFLKDYED
jgi:hypothetical protein